MVEPPGVGERGVDVHPSPPLQVAPPYGSKVRAEGTPWCIHVAEGLNSVKTGSKWAQFTCFCTPSGPGSFLDKCVFDPFLVPKRPILMAFWDFPWAKMCHCGLKMG